MELELNVIPQRAEILSVCLSLSLSFSHYRVSHPIMQRGFFDYFLGVPPACGPLLQLATAQAGHGNSLKLFPKNLSA